MSYWLDICVFCLEVRHLCGFINAHMRTQTEKVIIEDLSIVLNARIPLLLFKNVFVSILAHGCSKTHPTELLNIKDVRIPK